MRTSLGAIATDVLLIRHAQMAAHRDLDADVPLTDLGREQAEVLGEFLATPPIQAVYSSPLLRSRQTAEPIARHHGLAVRIEPDARDSDSYVPRGKTLADVIGSEVEEEILARFRKEGRWEVFGEYREPAVKLRQRAVAAVERIIATHPGSRVALVTHSPVINAYLAEVMEAAVDMPFTFGLTSISLVGADGDRRVLRAVNATPHFGTL